MTGMWTNEPPEAEAPAMPLTDLLLQRRERQAGVVETALARAAADDRRAAREAASSAPDPDEYASRLVVRGYSPGMITDLGQRLAEVTGELEAERAKIAEGQRVAAIAQRGHQAGHLDVWAVQRMLDRDFGDAHRAEQLERRADRLRQQLADAHAMLAPQPVAEDPLEQTSRAAHQIFRELTRAKMEAARAGRPEPRPFAGAGPSADAECTGPDCEICAEGRRRDAARAAENAPYAPGAVITTEYRETPACSRCGYVSCQCGVAGAYVPARGSAEVYR